MKTLEEIVTSPSFIEDTEKHLLDLMNENPDFVYSQGDDSCYYIRGPSGNPRKCSGCIFGQALQRQGWNKELPTLVDESISDLISYFGVKSPKYWTKIQKSQDTGNPWGQLKQYLENKNDS